MKQEQPFELSADVFYKNPVPLSITVPGDTRVIEVNEALVRKTGFSRKDMIGKAAVEIGIFEDPSDRLKIAQLMKQHHEVRDYECRFRTKSGGVLFGLVSVVGIQSKGIPFYLSSIIDITGRIQAEEKIKDQLEELRRWHEVILNRENRIIELKQEINELLISDGKPPKYFPAGQ